MGLGLEPLAQQSFIESPGFANFDRRNDAAGRQGTDRLGANSQQISGLFDGQDLAHARRPFVVSTFLKLPPHTQRFTIA